MKSNTPIIQRGFTLVEMMIVVAIVAILAVIALPSYERYIERGDATEAKHGGDQSDDQKDNCVMQHGGNLLV